MKFIGSDVEVSMLEVLRRYVPSVYKESKTMREINKADAIELENLYANVNDIMNQFFVETATWGLEFWEKEYDIPTDTSQSYESRRSMIYTKINANNSFTKESAEALLRRITNNPNALFIEYPETNSFETIYDVEDNIDFNTVLLAFKSVKPAHLYHIVGQIIKEIIDTFEILSTIDIDFKYRFTPEDINESDKVTTDFFLDGVFLLDGGGYLNGLFMSGSNGFINIRDELKIAYEKNGNIDIEII